MLKVRRSRDRLIFNMGIPIPGKDGLYIETGPWGFVCALWDIPPKCIYLNAESREILFPHNSCLSWSIVLKFCRAQQCHCSAQYFKMIPKQRTVNFAGIQASPSLKDLTHWSLGMPYGDRDLGQLGSGNGLLPDGTKPLPEPMLTYYQQGPMTFNWG